MDRLPYVNDPGQFVAGRSSATCALTLGMDSLPEQAPTIEEAGSQSIDLPRIGLEMMRTKTLQTMSEADRTAWYRARLGPYLNQINASARQHRLPSSLVGAIVLNELADIDVADLAQDALMIDGSIGYAQIQVATAIKNHLVSLDGDQKRIADLAQVKYDAQFVDPALPKVIKSLDAHLQETEWELTFHRLRVPQYAIEAAARELERLIRHMTKSRANVWQRLLGFSLASFDDIRAGEDLYLYINGKTDSERACNLARLCAAAYNSPEIIDAQLEESITPGSPGFKYAKGVPHGDNAWEVVRDLYALQPTPNALQLYSGWVGRVMANGDVTRYSQTAVPPEEYVPHLEGTLLMTGLVRITVTARAFSNKSLINNFLADLYECPEEEISGDMIPSGPVTLRIFSESLCRLLDGYSASTRGVYEDVLMQVAEGGTIDWSDYTSLPANLMLAEGAGTVSIQLDGAAIAARIDEVRTANPSADIDDAIDIRVCWYLDASEQRGENCQFGIESEVEQFRLRINK